MGIKRQSNNGSDELVPCFSLHLYNRNCGFCLSLYKNTLLKVGESQLLLCCSVGGALQDVPAPLPAAFAALGISLTHIMLRFVCNTCQATDINHREKKDAGHAGEAEELTWSRGVGLKQPSRKAKS